MRWLTSRKWHFKHGWLSGGITACPNFPTNFMGVQMPVCIKCKEQFSLPKGRHVGYMCDACKVIFQKAEPTEDDPCTQAYNELYEEGQWDNSIGNLEDGI
jgi:hypothetical protein